MSSTSLSVPGSGLENVRNLRYHKGMFKATDCIHCMSSPCTAPTHSTTLETFRKRLWLISNVGIQIIATCFIKDVN